MRSEINTPGFTPILELLAAYQPIDISDQARKESMIAFIRRHPDCCFERSLAEGHLTGSAWILDTTGTKALLTHHRKLDRWIQPGGHADGDPNIKNVALREALEESGLKQIAFVSEQIFDIDIHEIPAHAGVPSHLHYDVRFLFQSIGSDVFNISSESKSLKWVPLEAIGAFSKEESLERMRRKCSAFQISQGETTTL